MRLRRALPLLLSTILTAAAGASTAAAAPTTTLAPDPGAREVTALDGTVVWVSERPDGRMALMQLRDGRTAPVAGAPLAAAYRSIDLGRDAGNRLVLTYLRCSTPSSCVARRDDLAGRRASIGGLAVRGCSPTTAPALWRTRSAVGMFCRIGRTFDRARSGVYVKTGSGAPKLLRRPADALRAGALEVTSVDLRGTRVASILADIYAYAAVQDADGRNLQSYLAAASEGDGDQRANGLALGTGGALWSLATSEHAGDPPQTVIRRLTGTCVQSEVLTAPSAQTLRFPATDLAVDGTRLYLVVPGTGVSAAEFAPSRAC